MRRHNHYERLLNVTFHYVALLWYVVHSDSLKSSPITTYFKTYSDTSAHLIIRFFTQNINYITIRCVILKYALLNKKYVRRKFSGRARGPTSWKTYENGKVVVVARETPGVATSDYRSDKHPLYPHPSPGGKVSAPRTLAWEPLDTYTVL